MAEESLLLEIEGMTCDGCAETITRRLQQAPGVKDVLIDWETRLGIVIFDSDVTDEEGIVGDRTFRTNFKATVPPACC